MLAIVGLAIQICININYPICVYKEQLTGIAFTLFDVGMRNANVRFGAREFITKMKRTNVMTHAVYLRPFRRRA